MTFYIVLKVLGDFAVRIPHPKVVFGLTCVLELGAVIFWKLNEWGEKREAERARSEKEHEETTVFSIVSQRSLENPFHAVRPKNALPEGGS